MTLNRKGFAALMTCALFAAGLGMTTGIGIGGAVAQVSQEQIIRALKPPARVTRGLSASPADTAQTADDARFVDTLRTRTTRSLTANEREKIAAVTTQKPSIDLEINFEYNSATISSTATSQVTALGQALSSAELKGNTFVLAGHTDAKGADAYNLSLSERRADAVKRYLTQKFRLDANNLVTVGYGKTKLKNSSDPHAGENRRVQIVNMGDK